MYCRSCRKWFPNNILFCDICGKPLVKDLDIYGENFFNGDVQAFDYIYQNSYNWVAGEVRKMFSANSSEVEDCVQEIYLLLYRKIKYYDPRQGSFSAWFNALVRNRIYDYGRKLAGNREILPETSQQYFKEITDRNVYINPEARIEYAEREQILDEILDDIGEGQRICIQMYYNDGLKIKEIAQILNISEGTVKSRIHNGLKKLNTKVDEMQKRGLYTFRMLPLGFLLWLLSRDDCSAKEDYRALYHARTLAGQNVLQNAPMAAGNKAAGIKMAGRNQNVVKHASMQQAGQAGAKHAAINHAARTASRAGGKAIKAGMVKALAGGITAAVIGSGVFIGGKALKQHQGDKKVITSGQEYSTQEEKEGTPDSSVKEFVDDNQAFIKEILALEAEVPEGTEFQTDINENVRSVVYTSLGLLCDNKSFGEEATNIYDAVPEESIVDYNNNDDGEGTISVEESGFENMRQFLGCKETIGSLSATSSEEFLCQDGEVRAEGLSPSSDMQSSIKDIVYIPLSNGDERAIFTEQIIQDEIDGIGTAVITKADNDLGVQLKSYNIVADSDKIDQLLGSVAVLGKQLGSDGKLFSGNMTEMSDESKIHALIDSVRGYCYTEPNDEDIYANRAESLVYKPVFSEDDIKSNTEKSIIVKEDAFDDYLALVDYDGTIDDIVANKALQNKYNCSIKRNGTNIEFTFSGEFEMTYWWVETDMIDQINKDGFKILKNGKIEVDCLLYTSHATEPDSGVEYKATLSLNEDGSGMKLENLERV